LSLTVLSIISLAATVWSTLCLQVVAEEPGGEWSIPRPTELKPGMFADQLYTRDHKKHQEPIKEKNWMPFVWQEQLMMVHGVFPHRVFR
jgi:hypothetical protein